MTAGRTGRGLAELAQLHGIQLGYTSAAGDRVRATPDTLRAVLRALGHPADDAASIADELELVRRRATRTVEPVAVVESHGGLSSPVRVRRNVETSRARVTITTEEGATATHSLDSLAVGRREGKGSTIEVALDLGRLRLPVGYHQMTVSGVGPDATAELFVAPPPPRHHQRGFGAFAPLYALRGVDDWGAGSFDDLAEFAKLVADWGGELTGTLPLYAMFFREPFDPSPYLPVSRLFWNELYINVATIPEAVADPQAAAAVAAARPGLAALSERSDAELDQVMARKRPALEACARALVAAPSERRDDFDAYVKTHPHLERYADFRAANEAVGSRGGDDAVLYHRYVQYVAAEQLSRAAAAGAGLYLDLPVGIHPDGFDVWDNPSRFGSAEVGAPPDPFFEGGQAWGFPPLHPERVREDGYRHVAEVYRTAMQHAAAVRIDHVLGLQRLFWIPSGAGAEHGAYVRYRNEEFRAVIAIEAERSGTVVVGEDLGTVSPSIRRAMDRDGMLHTFVLQLEASRENPLPQPTRPSLASLGGHDLPRFATFWPEFAGGGDIAAALEDCLTSLAAGPARYLMVDVADLLQETVQDNRPGTGPEAGNWRHRLSMPLGELRTDRSVAGLISTVRTARHDALTKGVRA